VGLIVTENKFLIGAFDVGVVDLVERKGERPLVLKLYVNVDVDYSID
jgi:hypothetical protein